MSLREKIAFCLEDIKTPIGREIDRVITGLVLVSSEIFVVETYKISPSLREQLNAIEIGVLIIFVVKYLLRFWCAKEKAKYLLSL